MIRYATSRYTSLLFVVFAFALFLITSAPGIGTEDSGELTAGTRLLAMVHAPGYPLYLILGRLATALSSTPGRGLVLLSVIIGALAVGMTHYIVKRELGEGAAAISAISLTYCRGFWLAATEVEVYTLQTLLIASLLGALIHLKRCPDSGKARRLVAFLIGVTLAHHMGLTILLPPIVLFIAYVSPLRRGDWIRASGYCLAGVSLYLALPLLSTRNEIAFIGWKPIHTLSELLNVMGGAGFRKLLFAVPPDQVQQNLLRFPYALVLWFPLLTIPFALLGLVAGLRHDRAWTLLMLSIMMITIVHAANYNVLDPHRFLLPAIVPFAWLAGAGFQRLIAMRSLPLGAQSILAAVLLISATTGRLMEDGLFAASYDSMPADVARYVLKSHESKTDTRIVWTDWRLYPILRYYQLVDGLGRNVFLDFDSTSESPGSVYQKDRTWTMRASKELGARYALVMDEFQWQVMPPDHLRLSSRQDTDTRFAARLGGVSIMRVDRPEQTRPGEPIRVMITVRRDSAEVADTITGALLLMYRASPHPRMATPISLLHWSAPPDSWEIGAQYEEPVETLIPTAHAQDSEDSFTLKLIFATATESCVLQLGRVRRKY